MQVGRILATISVFAGGAGVSSPDVELLPGHDLK